MEIIKPILICLIALFATEVGAQADWEVVKNKQDLKVFVRKQEGSAFKEVKIEANISCSLSELVQALEDVESQSDWVESTKEARILEKSGSGSFVFYQGTDMPYPVKDRDVVMQYTRSQDPNSKVVSIDFVSVADKLPINKSYVRIPELHSSYSLTPSPNGNIAIEYLLKIDVGGKLPKWVVNMAITKGPIDTMEALFSAIKAGKYRGATIDGVVE